MKTMSNKLVKILSVAAVSGMLVGCSDASAKLSDSSTAIFSVGNKTITKGDMFTTMETMSGADTAINDATSTISSLEVEVTDDIKSQAEDTLSTYKSMYGDTFSNNLESQGITEEDYVNDYIIPSLLAEQRKQKARPRQHTDKYERNEKPPRLEPVVHLRCKTQKMLPHEKEIEKIGISLADKIKPRHGDNQKSQYPRQIKQLQKQTRPPCQHRIPE